MDDNTAHAKMWVDLLVSEMHAQSARHMVTQRAEVYLWSGLPLERVLDGLKISRATWYRRVAELRGWEAENAAASGRMLSPDR